MMQIKWLQKHKTINEDKKAAYIEKISILEQELQLYKQINIILLCKQNEEARRVAKKIKQTIQSGVEPKDIAVLFRSNMLTNAMEKALTREKIPYRVIGGTPLFARKAVKDIIAYLTLLVNPADDTRLK